MCGISGGRQKELKLKTLDFIQSTATLQKMWLVWNFRKAVSIDIQFDFSVSMFNMVNSGQVSHATRSAAIVFYR